MLLVLLLLFLLLLWMVGMKTQVLLLQMLLSRPGGTGKEGRPQEDVTKVAHQRLKLQEGTMLLLRRPTRHSPEQLRPGRRCGLQQHDWGGRGRREGRHCYVPSDDKQEEQQQRQPRLRHITPPMPPLQWRPPVPRVRAADAIGEDSSLDGAGHRRR